MNARFEVRLDGFGWPAVWDKEAGRFLPGRFADDESARRRAEMLNDGRAPIAATAPVNVKKTSASTEEPTLF